MRSQAAVRSALQAQRLGARELFVFYPGGLGGSRLRLPLERTGTGRNMNTVAKLAELAAELG